MSLKLSAIPIQASSLAPTDLMYVAADAGGGFFQDEKMPVSTLDNRFVNALGDTVNGNLFTTGLGTFGVAAPPFPNFALTVQDTLTLTSVIINNNRNPGGAAGSGGGARLMLHSNTLDPYGWSLKTDGATNHLLVQDDGSGNIGFFQGLPNLDAFGIGTPAPGFAVLLHRTANGILLLTNSAGTDFFRLQFGGITAAFPSIKRSGAGIEIRLADDSAYAKLTTGVAVITGSLTLPYRAIAGTDTFGVLDYTIDCTSGTFTLNLPTAVGIAGRIYVAKNSGVGVITLDGAGAETIDGAATQGIVAAASLTVQSTGAAWIII